MALCDFQGWMRKGHSTIAAVSWDTGSVPRVAASRGGGPQATSPWRNHSWRVMPEEPGRVTVPGVDTRGPQSPPDCHCGLSKNPSQAQRPSRFIGKTNHCYPFINK